MANMHLVTGYAGQEHVSSADQGILNATFMGKFQKVLAKGSKLSASVQTNNVVRVLDGDIFMQGRHIRLNENTYVDLTIENGQQGHNRNDMIVARYTKDQQTAIEEVNLVVIKGTAVDGEPSDPAYTEGNIYDGSAFLNDMPLYRVPLDGLNIGELVCLFSTFEDNLHDHTGNGTIHVTNSDKNKWNSMIPATQKGAANGVATLGADQKIPEEQLPVGTVMVRKNLLDNPRFKVNQQGQSSYVLNGSMYGVDRWRASGGQTLMTVTNDGVTVTEKDTGNRFQITSYLPELIDVGTVLTLTVLLTSGTLLTTTSAVAAYSQYAAVATIYHQNIKYIFRWGLDNTIQELIVGDNVSGYSASIRAIKLEIGEGQTLAYQDANGVWQLYDDYDYDADLASCTFNHYQIEGGFLGFDYATGIGAAKVEVGSYVGTGTYGPDNPNTLTFGFEPKAVFISVNSVILGPPTFIRGMESLVLFSPNDAMVRNGTCRLTWSGKTLTWHIDSGSDYGADVQYNAAKTYYYYAIG